MSKTCPKLGLNVKGKFLEIQSRLSYTVLSRSMRTPKKLTEYYKIISSKEFDRFLRIQRQMSLMWGNFDK